MGDHPSRNCMGCGQVDDHPRHHEVLPDGSSAYWHMDCHARVEPPCEACKTVTDSHGNRLTGDELRQHIVANDPIGAAQRAATTTAGQGVSNG